MTGQHFFLSPELKMNALHFPTPYRMPQVVEFHLVNATFNSLTFNATLSSL